MKRVLSWLGFILIAAAVAPTLPPGLAGLIVALLVLFLFLPTLPE